MEIGSLDPDLLLQQFADISAMTPGKTTPLIENLFWHWLSLPDTQRLVLSLLEDVKAGAASAGNMNLSCSSPIASLIQAASTPPLSPRSSSGSPFSPKSPMPRSTSGFTTTGSPLKRASEPVREIIPQFYYPNGPPVPKEISEQYSAQIEALFSGHPEGLALSEFLPITTEMCKLPSYFSSVLFKQIDVDNTGLVSRESFMIYWIGKKVLLLDLPTRIFNILKQPNNNYLTQDDFRPILRKLLSTHRGLEFLQDTPEFQEIYAGTVIHRIFYHVNRSGNGRITLRELKRSNLVSTLFQVDEEEDINKVLKYFSYKHFYVIYCKFWELDTDHDFLIDKDDLLRYGNHSLTYRIVERIFSQVPRKFTGHVPGKMGYGDFVWFILSEEDKTSEPSLEYWFKSIDLDCNGVLTRNEMQYFYEEQLHRMECMGQEPVLFDDIMCQMFDMICPQTDGMFLLRDLKRCKLAGNLFNVLFNLKKFISFETRDPVLISQEREDPTLTDWDRFAHQEYGRISIEDDGDDVSNGSAEVWDESLEAPF